METGGPERCEEGRIVDEWVVLIKQTRGAKGD